MTERCAVVVPVTGQRSYCVDSPGYLVDNIVRSFVSECHDAAASAGAHKLQMVFWPSLHILQYHK